jgi:DNA-binding NarL/FixJ family response regulator
MKGELYVPPLVLEGNRGSAQSVGYKTGNRPEHALTARQVEILKCLSEGAPNKSIAKVLGLSEKTVKAHITAIFKTLNVENRTQAAVTGRNAGLI